MRVSVLELSVLLLAVVALLSFAQEDDSNVPDAPGDDRAETLEELEARLKTGGDPYTPEEGEEPIDPEMIQALLRYCKEFRYTYHPLVNAKEEHQPEAELMRLAISLGEYLADAKEDHMKKDHQHFSCDEAKIIVEHSTAKQFMGHFKELIDGTVEPKIPNEKVLKDMLQLTSEFQESGLVNDEVLYELGRITAGLQHLQNWYPQIKKHYDAVITARGDYDCKPDYQKFLAELKTLSMEHIPKWTDIDHGLLSLIEQCAEDPYLKSEL